MLLSLLQLIHFSRDRFQFAHKFHIMYLKYKNNCFQSIFSYKYIKIIIFYILKII
jgi:hypothetical protein